MIRLPLTISLILSFPIFTFAENVSQLPNTKPLTMEGDLAAQMVAGIDCYLMRETGAAAQRRSQFWNRDLSSHENYTQSIAPNRERLQKILGLADDREPVTFSIVSPISSEFSSNNDKQAAGLIGAGANYKIYNVRWSVLKNVDAEGLLLQPDQTPIADLIALPDCDQTPEMLCGLTEGIPLDGQFARRLAENGCRVLIPTLIDRHCDYSGIEQYRMTNQPHREYLYRAAYEMGRTMIGYEIQKILAAIDWFTQDENVRPTGVIGYGEGGLLAFYSTAVDTRIDAAAVLGYFQPREELWREPIYRNVWSLLKEFGAAETAAMIAPRSLIIEACKHPEIEGPPQLPNRSGAAPGVITTPPFATVEREARRANELIEGLKPSITIPLIKNLDGPPGCEEILSTFLTALDSDDQFIDSKSVPKRFQEFDPESRMKRQFTQILEHTQSLMRESEFTRAEFWNQADASSLEAWKRSSQWYRDYFWDEIIGRLPESKIPMNPRSRLVYDEPKYRGYEIVLDVYPDVFAYGILLLPKDIQPGERRPVVVCQHGLEGRPQDVADPSINKSAYGQFACQLAERGFITFAPQNPYIGQDRFRVLQRKAHPLGLSLFAFITRQHERILQWLSSLPPVDPERIAFYGLSYGGKTAMRAPALLDGYCLSICSADFNEWIWKNVSTRHRYSYLITGEYDMMEFNIGETFNYAELSWLICPRPFMVERGHHDGVAPDEWVAYEFAKVKRHYVQLGIGDRAEIEFFDGPHMIHGKGTFDFLHRHLNWRKPNH